MLCRTEGLINYQVLNTLAVVNADIDSLQLLWFCRGTLWIWWCHTDTVVCSNFLQ